MFLNKMPVALLAGMAMVGAIVVAPGAFADSTAGRALAWGWNSHGQLGNGSKNNLSFPFEVSTAGPLSGKTITAISAGGEHTCVVADGQVYCWGYNAAGQLGNGTTADSTTPVAVAFPLAGTVTAISAGGYHTCAVAEGQAYCWGDNDLGQLGDDTTTDSSVPVAVASPLAGTITAITVGEYHTCAVAEGQAYCWGSNFRGQLGDGTTNDSSVPVAVNTSGSPLEGKSVTTITAGTKHTCAVADGQASCWGLNFYGQLGNGTITDSPIPVAVNTSGTPLDNESVTAISAGSGQTCAVVDGRAYCWGHNSYGQLGDGTTAPTSTTPVAVATSGTPMAGATVTAITAGDFHSCVVANGQAYCWGATYFGQLGNRNNTNSGTPVAVDTSGSLAGKTVTAITAGTGHSAVLAAAPPQPPTAVTGVPGSGQVSVSWNAPGDDGGSPVLDYTVTAVPGGASCTTSSTSCTITGLANGTSFTFTVTARNAIGTSSPTAPSSPVVPTGPVTPTDPPVTPTDPPVTPTDPPVTPTDPPVAPGQPPVVQKQTASVKVPKRIKYKGKTVLLKKAVWTNAGQKGASKITVKPKAKKYAKVKTTKKGKVTIKTFGKKKLKVTLKLTAPATSEYTAYSYKKKWAVKK
jgi:alpha-tubulin suppressor-like RCC1 family protein